MLNQKNRIKKRKEFGYIYRNGETVFSKNLVVMYTTNKFKTIRVGFSISKKVGKAYIRNKIKRQLRAIVRNNMDFIPSSRNYVVIAKPSIINKSFIEIQKELIDIFGKLNKGKEKDVIVENS